MARSGTACWNPALRDAEALTALALAQEVARRLSDAGAVDQAVMRACRRTEEPRLVHWRPEGLWQGYAGLALLSSAMDASFPDSGWDSVGHEQLRRAARGIEGRTNPAVGLSAGLSGVATATWALSRGTTRYGRLLATLDAALVGSVEARVAAILRTQPHGVDVSTFDVISGLTGSGRYLLARRDQVGCRHALRSALRGLVYLAEEDGSGVPHLHTALEHTTGAAVRRLCPHGHVNLGLAHGIAGPLALMAMAMLADIEVSGQSQAVVRIADRLARSQQTDEWGVNFPNATALVSAYDGSTAADALPPSRAAWCYGAPGIARALWLAGAVTQCVDYQDLAVEAMAAVYRRPVEARRIDSPTACHGVAGLLQVTLRFAQDCPQPVFAEAARELTADLLRAYEPGSTFGYRNLEPSGTRLDHPGLLDGAAGTALALLAAASPVVPTWDSVLLVS